jgi:hypothetical protein
MKPVGFNVFAECKGRTADRLRGEAEDRLWPGNDGGDVQLLLLHQSNLAHDTNKLKTPAKR